jgi:mannosyltransferase
MLETAETIKRHRATLAAVSLVVVIGALLRFHNLDGESLWLDEAASWTQAKDSLADLIKRTADDNYPPLHNLALFAAIKLFGDSEWSLRLPSATFGVANIVALYWLGTMTVGRTAGLIGAVLLALSPFHLWYSQEARMYSLLALAATLYAATCFHYLRAPALSRGAWVSLAGLALVYSHPYGALDWIAIAVAFAVFVLPPTSPPPRTMLVWAVSNAIVAAGFAPWARILAGRAQEIAADGFWIPAPTLPFVLNNLISLAGGRLFAGVILIGVVLGIVGRLRRDVAVLCVWIVAPAAIGIVASIPSTPIFMSRYVIGSLPPLILLSAFGWTKYAKDWRGAILSTAVVAVAGLALLRYTYHPNAKDDWRGVASFLDEREQPTDCVLVVPDYFARVLHYYRRTSSCQWGALNPADLPAEIPASVLFGVFSLSDIRAWANAAVADELRRRGWRDLDRADFRGVQVVTFSR